MYRSLNPAAIVTTCGTLCSRIAERFPDSGLSRVSNELLTVARESSEKIERLRRPNWPIRIGVILGLALAVAAAAGVVLSMRVQANVGGLSDLLQGLEAGVNDMIFMGLAVFFLFTVENRLKRRIALRSLHELRSIAHVIDMHQLTKDPEQIVTPAMSTASSPQRVMTRFALARYLDYCSELLSITSKLAALYVQYLDDALVLSAVNDIQSLSAGLSAKIWQKLDILNSVTYREAVQGESGPAPASPGNPA